ncbi:unnamed protein product, partial [marine sediment metagenome]
MSRALSIIVAVVLIVSVTGAAFFLEDRYAKADELKNNEARLTVHIAQDRIQFLQQQVWALEDRCGKDERLMTPDQRTRYRELTTEKG